MLKKIHKPSDTSSKNDKNDIYNNFNKVKIRLYFKVIQITLGNLLIFLSFGYIIGAHMNIKPVGIVIGVLFAFVTTQIMLAKYVKKVSREEFGKSKSRKNNNNRLDSNK